MNSEGLFVQVRAYAEAHGLPFGLFGICPICEGKADALVRIGAYLYVDPCAHAIAHLAYVEKKRPYNRHEKEQP